MSEASVSAKPPTLAEFENLFVNNADLDTIRAHLNKFNPIKTMGMERMEIRHSAILAWLLDPQQTHGLGDEFLRSFLAEALRGRNDPEGPNALEVSESDMMDAEVRREWHNIDLLVVSQSLGCAFVIENKYDSSQHSNQLERYMATVEETFGRGGDNLNVKGVFLTLWDEDPDDNRYAPINYSAICELLPRLIKSRPYPLSVEVSTFIEHYLDVIKEATGMNDQRTELETLARKLYRDHRRLIDFITEHGATTDFAMAVETLFGSDPEWMSEIRIEESRLAFNYISKDTVSFLPMNWYSSLGEQKQPWDGCEGWWAEYPLIVWLELTPEPDGIRGKIRLFASVGPLSDHDFRRELIEAIKQVAADGPFNTIRFQSGAATKGKMYSKFLKQNSFPIQDVNDQEQIETAMRKALRKFKPEFDAIAEVLPKFKKFGRSE